MTHLPTQALILAGGLGTRLRSVVSDVPKPMADVMGKPFLAYVVDYWITQGVTRFVFSVGYKGEHVRNYFGDHYQGAAINYVEEEEPLGTGGALKHALTNAQWNGTHLLMLNGDTAFMTDGAKLAADATRNGAPITLTLKSMDNNDRYGGVVVDGTGKVTDFESNRPGKMLINVGCYVLDRDRIAPLLADYPPRFSFEDDVLKPWAPKGLLAASIQEKPFLDIGIPSDYERAAAFLSQIRTSGAE